MATENDVSYMSGGIVLLFTGAITFGILRIFFYYEPLEFVYALLATGIYAFYLMFDTQ